MDTNTLGTLEIAPPKGFVLEEPKPPLGFVLENIPPPEGFALEEPEQKPEVPPTTTTSSLPQLPSPEFPSGTPRDVRAPFEAPKETQATIGAWKPSLWERAKMHLYTPPPPGGWERSDRPFRALGRAVLYGLGKYGTGRALYAPKLVDKDIAKKLSGFDPTVKEKDIGDFLEFMGGLRTAGQILGPHIKALPGMSQQAILGSTGIFGLRNISEQLVDWAATGKTPSLESFEKDAALGALFGTGEAGLITFVGFIKGLKGLSRAKLRPARMEVDKALKHYKKTGDRAAWDKVRIKYAGIKPEGAEQMRARAAPPPPVKEFGKYPLALAKRPPITPVKPSVRPVALRKPTEPTAVAPKGKITTKRAGEGVYNIYVNGKYVDQIGYERTAQAAIKEYQRLQVREAKPAPEVVKATEQQKALDEFLLVEKPSSQATAYEKPQPARRKEMLDEIMDARRKARMRPGFARIPTLKEFQEVSQKLKDNIAKINKPQRDVVTNVFGAIEKWRAETNKAGVYADWGKRALNKVKATPKQKRLVDDWLDNPEQYQVEFDKLPNEVKEMGKVLRTDYKDLLKLGRKEGILKSWIDAYTPHIYTDSPDRLRRILYPTGGKLGTKFKFGRQRTILTKDEARKLGFHPIDDPVLKNSIYKYQFYRTIASKNLIETFKNMTREDGMKLISGRPKRPDRLKVWENEYQWVNHPALARFMYVGEVGEKPMLIKMSAKADPEVAKMLNNVFSLYQPKGKLYGSYLWARGRIKRIIMLNPVIHGTNIFSDVLDEMNFNPYSTVKAMVRGHKLYKQRDAIVERAVNSGLEIQARYGIARDLRNAMLESSETLRGALAPVGKLEQLSDEILWQGIVRNSQIGLFEALTKRVGRTHPDWPQDKVDKVISTHINTLLGTLPPTWFSRVGRVSSSVAFFARNWTVSNIDLVVRAMTMGRKGLGVKALTPEMKTELGKMNAKHLAKGIFGLIAIANLLQFGFLSVTNKLKKKGILKGQKVPLHTTFKNESWRHWIDVDTGLKNAKGQTIYLVPPLFRYIRDYFGYATQPAKTVYNKLEPLLKNFTEQLFNYSVWQQKNITEKGAPTWDNIKARIGYFVKSITPSQFYAHKPGTVKTPFEWFIPFTGTWIRRGAPGGRFTSLLWEFRTERGYKKSKLDERIDESLQSGKFEDALEIISKGQRYKTAEGVGLRILQMNAPLNYYWRTTGKDEKVKFLQWLEKEKGVKAPYKEFSEALKMESQTLAKRED